MTKEKIKWHPAFAAAIQLELKEYKQYLDFEEEHVLTDEPLKIDVVVIKKLKDIEIDKPIGRILRKYNIFEYKSPTDYISIDDYYKVKAYAYLYKVLSKDANSIDIEEMTITLISAKYPRKLIEYLKGRGIIVKQGELGVYYFENTDVRTQLLITKELSDGDAEYLKLLELEHKNKDILSRWVYEYIKNIKNPLYAVIMDVLAKSNPNEILEVYKNMGLAKLSEDNRIFLMDAVKKLEIDKKFREEGREEGKIETAKNLLKLGVSIEVVMKATGFSEKEVMKIKEEIDN